MVRMVLAVCVDLTSEELLAGVIDSMGSLTIDGVVHDEIVSHLKTVSYVRRVSIIQQKGGVR